MIQVFSWISFANKPNYDILISVYFKNLFPKHIPTHALQFALQKCKVIEVISVYKRMEKTMQGTLLNRGNGFIFIKSFKSV